MKPCEQLAGERERGVGGGGGVTWTVGVNAAPTRLQLRLREGMRPRRLGCTGGTVQPSVRATGDSTASGGAEEENLRQDASAPRWAARKR